MDSAPAASAPDVYHHFTVDVEEYFQVSALEPFVPPREWDSIPSRVSASVREILRLLAEHDARATFFVLGWVAERHPNLIRTISRAGHEVASHGSMHQRVTTIPPEVFRRDVRRAKHVLEDLTGQPVLGYRAPSFSIVPGSEWALEILVEEGHQYDSSLFPIARHGYGFPGGARDPYRIHTPSGCITEVPPTTLRWGGQNIPAAGGAYFRLFPLWVFRQALRESEDRGVPGTFYIHPWEVDPEQPRIPSPLMTRIRHYTGLRRTLPRLGMLMREFPFRPILDSLAQVPV